MASALQFQFSSDSESESEDEIAQELSTNKLIDNHIGNLKVEKRISSRGFKSKRISHADNGDKNQDGKSSFGRAGFFCSVKSLPKGQITNEDDNESTSMNSGTRELLKSALKKHPLFQSLVDDVSVLQMICAQLTKQEVVAGQDLWKQNDKATMLYFIQSGKFHLFKDIDARTAEKVSIQSTHSNARKSETQSQQSSRRSVELSNTDVNRIVSRDSMDFGKVGKNAKANENSLHANRKKPSLNISKTSNYNEDYVASTDVYGTSASTSKGTVSPAAVAVSPKHFMLGAQGKAHAGSYTARNGSSQVLVGQRPTSKTSSTAESTLKTRKNSTSWRRPVTTPDATKPTDIERRPSGMQARPGSLTRGLSWVKTQLQSKGSLRDLVGKQNSVSPDPSSMMGSNVIESSGTLKIRVKGQNFKGEEILEFTSGDTAGDHSLFYGIPRSTTVTCVSDAIVWGLDAIVFRHFIALADSTERGGFGDELKETPTLRNLSAPALQLVGQEAKMIHFPKGEQITVQGQSASFVYVLQSGKVRGRKHDNSLCALLEYTRGGNCLVSRHSSHIAIDDADDASPGIEVNTDGPDAEQSTSKINENPAQAPDSKDTLIPSQTLADPATNLATTTTKDVSSTSPARDVDDADEEATVPLTSDAGKGTPRDPNSNFIEFELHEQQVFGASLLDLDGVARSDTFAETEDVFCIKVPVSAFQKHFTQEDLEHSTKLTALLTVELLSMMEPSKMKQFQDNTELAHFKRGDLVIKAGSPATRMYVISKGTCLCLNPDTRHFEDGSEHQTSEVALLSIGDCFGEVALFPESDKYNDNVYAAEDVTLWPFERAEFVKLVSASAATKKQLQQLVVQRVLQQVPVLKTLRSSKLKQVSAIFEQKSFEDGHIIVKEGAPGTDFFVIWNGCVRITKETKEKGIVHLCDLHGGDFFGEMALLSNGIRSTNCTAVGRVECFVISQNSFTRMVGEELLPAMQSVASERVQYTSATLTAAKNKILDDMQLADLEIIKPIGKGGFGYVQLVKYTKDGSTYALKQINKRRLFSSQGSNATVENIIVEKNALFDIKHPFSVRPIKTFVDECNMYILMELIEAGELYEVIQNRRNKTRNRDSSLKAPHASFYAACVISVLSYMHQRRYVYRDLKPENLMIDSGGFLKVIDFGLVKRLLENHTYTFCGTPEYLAPEIIAGKGYAFEVDWWSLGILVFEMLVGVTPFRDAKADQIMKNVMEAELVFPESFKDQEAIDLISKLLDRNSETRLGGTAAPVGGKDVKNHKWLAAVNWKGIIERHVKPPWTPKFKDSNEWEQSTENDASVDSSAPSNWKNDWDKAWLEIPRM